MTGVEKLNAMFESYKHTSDYKDMSMLEIMAHREEFEKNLDEMWAIYQRGNLKQVLEYKKGIRMIKDAGLVPMRNSAGKHKIVYKK